MSPQFHIKYDENFDTVKDTETQEGWKIKAGFKSQRHMRPSAKSKNGTYIPTSTKRTIELHDSVQIQKPKKVKFAPNKERGETMKSPNQRDKRK